MKNAVYGQISLFEEPAITTTEEYAHTFETREQQMFFAENNRVDYTALFAMVDEMNDRGIKIDTARLDAHIAKAQAEVQLTINSWVDELTSQGIDYVDYSSQNEIIKLFFSVLNFPVLKTTPTGKPALDKKILDVYGENNILPVIYKKIKSAQKILKMLTNIKAAVVNGRIYPQLHVDGAASGRFTCDGVNIQQFPESFRDIVVADEGTLVYIDYSQIEYRVQATLAKDQRAIEAFRNGQDAHTQLAELLGISREKAKIINYAVSYGMTPYGLAIELGTNETEAQRIINDYWRAKSKVAAKKAQVIRWAHEHGFVPTIYGFSRSVSSMKKDDQIWSTSIQGSAADLMKRCMNNVDAHLKATNSGRVLTNIHDALLIEVTDMAQLDNLINIFKTVDSRFVLDVSVKIGTF